ncbi:MAG: hypothetical protein HQK67_04400, partial [Desulfamplus sp.]|nr:hypothetical protein [Desulfamplus sp.]
MNLNIKNIIMTILNIVISIIYFSNIASAELPASLVMATIHQPQSYEGRLSNMIYQEAFKR